MTRESPSVGVIVDNRARLHTYYIIKRIVDIIGSASCLILFSPLLLLTAVLIKTTGRGPVIFSQIRVGKDGKEFRFYKFRSMVREAHTMQEELQAQSHHDDARTFKIPNDPRITWLGAFLRRSSIDEMPQLWNVLRGDMSLVGPRPPVPSEVALYSPRDWERLTVLPGLTGFWQIYGRGNLPFSKQVVLDIEYIRQQSLWTDFMILVLTIPAVLSCRGAY